MDQKSSYCYQTLMPGHSYRKGVSSFKTENHMRGVFHPTHSEDEV